MTDDKLDPTPSPDQFARVLAARAASAPGGPDPARWLRGWHGREGAWTSLRNVDRWIERADAWLPRRPTVYCWIGEPCSRVPGEPPPVDEQRPNETSWTDFRKQMDVAQSK